MPFSSRSSFCSQPTVWRARKRRPLALGEITPRAAFIQAAALILATVFGVCLRGDGESYRDLFRHLNLSLAVVMTVIMVDGIALS